MLEYWAYLLLSLLFSLVLETTYHWSIYHWSVLELFEFHCRTWAKFCITSFVTRWAKTRHIAHFMKIEIRPEIGTSVYTHGPNNLHEYTCLLKLWRPLQELKDTPWFWNIGSYVMTNLLLHLFMASLSNYSSQGVSKLPGLGYTDMQELLMSVHACTGFVT